MSAINEVDEAIVMHQAPGVRRRARIELKVVRRVIRDLLRAGYEVRADNGEDEQVTGTPDQLIECLFAVDEAHLRTRKLGDLGNLEQRNSFVFLVFGNDGWDVISDYGVSLESVMGPINDWTDKQQEDGR